MNVRNLFTGCFLGALALILFANPGCSGDDTTGTTAKTSKGEADDGGGESGDDGPPPPGSTDSCERTVIADVVSLYQRIEFNRLGTAQSSGMVYALARDVRVAPDKNDKGWNYQWLPDTAEWKAYAACQEAGSGDCHDLLDAVAAKFQASDPNEPPKTQVQMRPDKRPRPLIVRANAGDCVEVNLVNLLPNEVAATAGAKETNLTNTVGFHPVGLQLVDAITNDNQYVGANPESMTAPGKSSKYLFLAGEPAVHFVSSSSDAQNGLINAGLFGAVHVEPEGAEYYRSQVVHDDLKRSSTWKGPSDDQYLEVDYQAQYPGTPASTKPWKQTGPVLNMLEQIGGGPGCAEGARCRLMYSDLTAIITGPKTGKFEDTKEPPFNFIPAAEAWEEKGNNRVDPFREFAILYHEPGAAAQAFTPLQDDRDPIHETLEAGADKFGINYGTGGISAEIYANRIKKGPMGKCEECRYEEFFLSAWTVGDPAMNVNNPTSRAVDLGLGPATLAYYPDDPSNVYHSYLNDRVKMQLHHGGGIHHVHHLHAHQWLHSPNNPNGHYLDSQLFGPGSSFTLEIAYGGSGNRNRTVGDSIFHCHFYPHFAQGMWGMWRVHDVLEVGTELEPSDLKNPDSRPWPKQGARALPDGEIVRGTPIPAIVPLPTKAEPPSPSEVYIADGQTCYGAYDSTRCDRVGADVKTNPGYPFFIPGIAGHRAPHPPMDFAEIDGKVLDGGLPRHIVLKGEEGGEFHNKFDFSKFDKSLQAMQLPEDGTPVEKIAMAAMGKVAAPLSSHSPDGTKKPFLYNGLPAVPGAPYAEPCLTDESRKTPRHYRASDIQHDVVLNKDGWHYPQQRFITLWGDIQPTFDNKRPPEPFFFRANSGECIDYWLANLVPYYYELDNFQVRTPTDILGQHIHLVKFDVTSSDGSANGFNYEDGTFSYQEVQARIADINKGGGLAQFGQSEALVKLKAEPAKFLPIKDQNKYSGAQATVQRWWADPLLNNAGVDRTIRTVFTHDHFGPSTHQQAGLYAGLLVEPEGSTWVMAELDKKGNEVPMYTRPDGGPTSWQAVIKPSADGGTMNEADSYREFALEFQDLALAYSFGKTQLTEYPTRQNKEFTYDQSRAQDKAINSLSPTDGKSIREGGTFDGAPYNGVGGYIYCGDAPCKKASTPPIAAPSTPQAISSLGANFDTAIWGTYSTNYRSEPLAMHLAATNTDPTKSPTSCTAGTPDCDTGFAFKSMTRQNTALNRQPKNTALTSGVYPTDPYTPMLRAHAGEKIQIRTLVGAHVQMHNFSVHGMSWLFEPSAANSGYRDSQSMGISEHFEMNFRMPPATTSATGTGAPSNTCGAFTATNFADYLYATSSSTAGLTQGNWGLIRSYGQEDGTCLTPVPATPKVEAWACPSDAPVREFNVQAHNQTLDVNGSSSTQDALVYTGCDATMAPDCTPAAPGKTMAPLILRAKAGECIKVTLTNEYDAAKAPLGAKSALTNTTSPDIIDGAITFNGVEASASTQAGLHPQMLAFDPASHAGINVGFNPDQTVGPGEPAKTYTWYAGSYDPLVDPITAKPSAPEFTPVEFGVVNLYAPDPLRQANVGAIGAMVIEPADSSWSVEDSTSINAKITDASGKKLLFHDLVLLTTETATDNWVNFSNGILANYGTEPLDAANGRDNPVSQYSDTSGGPPNTPIFEVPAGATVRLRVVHPWGLDQGVFELYGHVWEEEPFSADGLTIANNPQANHQGFRAGWGSTDRLNVVIPSAGGPGKVTGDYLYRLRDIQVIATKGVWGILRVK